jgi:hypothetical protein
MSIASDIQAVEAKVKTEVDLIGSKLDTFLKADIEPLEDQTIQDLEAAAGPILKAAWAQVLALIASKINSAAS